MFDCKSKKMGSTPVLTWLNPEWMGKETTEMGKRKEKNTLKEKRKKANEKKKTKRNHRKRR